MSSLVDQIARLPTGWRFHMGHTPHWYYRKELPKFLKKKPYEAYVANDIPIGVKGAIFESADGETLVDALKTAIDLAFKKAGIE